MDERALVVHLFAPAGRSTEPLERLWRDLGDRLGMTWSIPELGPYELRPDEPPRGRVLAARQSRSRSEIFQAVVWRRHDVLALLVALAPPARDGTGWAELEARWARVAGDTSAWALGEARLLTCVGPGLDTPLDEAPHGFAAEGARLVAGGHTALMEEPGAEGRALRRFLAVAAARERAASDAWLWSRGTDDFPPLAAHLLHAAKVRHQLRVREGFDADRLLGPADRALRLRRDGADGADGADDLVAERRRLSELLAGPEGLTLAATRMREMERTVRIAAANMRQAHGELERDPGPVRDDLELAGWLEQRLADDLLYLEAGRERVRDALTEAIQAADEAVQDRRERLQRREEAAQRRRERIDLLQTAVIGSVLMVLAAVQAFQYRVPLPGPVTPAVIAALGSLALLLATVTLWRAADQGRGAGMAVRVFGGLACAALAWVGCAVLTHLLAGTAAPVWLTWTVAVPSFGLGAVLIRPR
ncbi:CATRA conflict system CASPASE/TPR repeat-associated protein [Nonomuraea sp. NPDC049152]|uniref:CATRA conflict system CASPASE/TPR repeat-associated protein n=1 Tax=Nonomuraea sp. NPDC049152 TaxID=3154350 RepID=UPI0033C8ACEC